MTTIQNPAPLTFAKLFHTFTCNEHESSLWVLSGPAGNSTRSSVSSNDKECSTWRSQEVDVQCLPPGWSNGEWFVGMFETSAKSMEIPSLPRSGLCSKDLSHKKCKTWSFMTWEKTLTEQQPPFAHLIPVLFQALHGLCATLQLLLHGVGVDFGLSRRDLQSVSYRLLCQGGNQSSLKPLKCMMFTPLSGHNVHPIHSKYIECATLFFYLWPPAGWSCILARKHQETPQHQNSRFFFCKLLIATVHNKQHLSFWALKTNMPMQNNSNTLMPTQRKAEKPTFPPFHGPWNKLFSLCSELLLLCRVRTCWYRHLPGVTAGNCKTVWRRNESKDVSMYGFITRYRKDVKMFSVLVIWNDLFIAISLTCPLKTLCNLRIY